VLLAPLLLPDSNAVVLLFMLQYGGEASKSLAKLKRSDRMVHRLKITHLLLPNRVSQLINVRKAHHFKSVLPSWHDLLLPQLKFEISVPLRCLTSAAVRLGKCSVLCKN
jgi:hypothetical protein